MRNLSTNKELIKFANRLVKKTNTIDVLKQDYQGQYSSLVTLVDDSFKKSLHDKTLLLPELNNDGNESTAIFSDYGGEAPDSDYLTYSFLICGWNHSYGLEVEMKSVREKHGLGEKEISFKDFRYGPIRRALPEYLQCLNNYTFGLLFTVVVDKKVGDFFNPDPSNPKAVVQQLEQAGLGVWKPKVAEKLLRITHIAAYLAGLLANSEQKLLWMTDSDAIASTDKQLHLLLKTFERILPMYTKEPFKLLGGAIPFEERSVKMLDLLSCADIAAGCIEHYFTRKARMQDSLTIKEEANLVLEWLGRDGVGLKKKTIMIQLGEDPTKVVFGEVKIEAEDNGEMQFVPIFL
ncbi:hypothetical protein [Shewanella algae]|uniref:hypothetical protein n=1 Tax=Shewanella algae TaxID=38313 RepID=UPI0031F59E31